ncbi:Hypothetical protein, putative [Bodo saltans]|uniref:Uncharacterized protein n=1 Tax=Bodo saltans TaxID=75058 RepID=A0A0S4IL80_BODSA|nr:Hypothetical protein, putative [Bodo saltans]|eukprot:CUE71015.1 Hypothetical protein, putative [Bodo saltans]
MAPFNVKRRSTHLARSQVSPFPPSLPTLKMTRTISSSYAWKKPLTQRPPTPKGGFQC